MNSGDRNPEEPLNGSDVHDGACVEDGGEEARRRSKIKRSKVKHESVERRAKGDRRENVRVRKANLYAAKSLPNSDVIQIEARLVRGHEQRIARALTSAEGGRGWVIRES